jgi:thymidylate synthase
MQAYLDLVDAVLREGSHERNRTGVDTVASFSHHYSVDLADGFPLLTTKRMDTFRWDSMLYELLWYLSGEHHVRELSEHTGIWDAWADKGGNLPTAYGRFWRRFPVPETGRLPGEWWADPDADWVADAAERYDTTERAIRTALGRWLNDEDGATTFDQLRYVTDTLAGENPMRPPESRRLVLSAWHPGNAAVSHLPPCHYTVVFDVQGGRLHTHLTQRSADVALGVPFNIAAYAILARVVAAATGHEPGRFAHALVDTHVYCGRGDRGAWYADNLEELQERLRAVQERPDYATVAAWVEETAPPEAEGEAGHDHVPGLLRQCSREPLPRPRLDVDVDGIDDLRFEDVRLREYEAHDDDLDLAVAE